MENENENDREYCGGDFVHIVFAMGNHAANDCTVKPEGDKHMTKFRYMLECPRCNKISDTIMDTLKLPHVNCGDCLMDHTEVVEMTITAVSEVKP